MLVRYLNAKCIGFIRQAFERAARQFSFGIKGIIALFTSWALLCGVAMAGDISVEYHGAQTQGGVIVGKTQVGNRLSLQGVNVPVSDQGYFVLGFGRDAVLDQQLTITSSSGKTVETRIKLEKRTYKTQHVEGVPANTVNPPPERLARIKKETAQVRTARKNRLNRDDFLQPFVAPSKGRITGVYGSQRYYNGVPKRPHYGIDYAGPVGAPVIAPASGVVTLVHPDMFYSGGTLIIDHGQGLSSTFIHLSKVLVKEGDEVAQGELIAEIGAGGRSTGPHLDWRMNWLDQRVDPAMMLKIRLPDDF